MSRVSVPPYYSEAFGDLGPMTERLRNDIAHLPRIDTFIGVGLSGALVVPHLGRALGRALGRHWAIVRKIAEISHFGGEVVGQVGDLWLFVDDLIESGKTLQHAVRAIGRCPFGTKFAGAWTYKGWASQPPGYLSPDNCPC